MPLDRAHITSASVIMLPTYALMGWAIGLLLIFQDDSRTATSPAFTVARQVMDIRLWGVLFCCVAAVETASLVVRNRKQYILGLTLGAGLCAFWTMLILASAYLNGSSYTSAVWPAVVVAAHFASTRSLARREGARR